MLPLLRRWLALGLAAFLPALLARVGQAYPVDLPLRAEAQAKVAAWAAAVVGTAPSPLALVVAEGSTSPLRSGNVFVPPAASKLDLSPWLIEDGTKMATLQENSSEYAACVHVFVTAHRTPWEDLSRGARTDLTFAHLLEEPAKYRGEIVRVAGRITRVRRFDPPPLAAKEGVRDFYEGWLFGDRAYGAHATCLVFSELPPGMAVGESVNYPAVFDGYFFKRYRYKGGDDRWREAPLLIGHMPVLARHEAGAEDALGEGTSLVMAFLGLLAGTLFLALGLAWWYRRGDRLARARLDAARRQAFVNPWEAGGRKG